MMNKSLVVVIVVAGLLSLFLFSPGESYASQQSFSDVQITNPATLPYRGNLANLDGVAVEDGRYDFTFTLYAEDDKQAPPWSEEQLAVNVAGGVFTVQLGVVRPLPPGLTARDHLLLGIAVRGPGEGEYTSLNPPQELSPGLIRAPESTTDAPACAHDHFGETWTGSNQFGIKVTSTAVEGVGAFFEGRRGVYGSGSSVGVVGSDDLYFVYPTTHVGVWGESNNATGYGGMFTNEVNDHLDIKLGGTYGRVNANQFDESTLWLSSNSDVVLGIDNDGGEDHYVKVKNSGGTNVCTIDEAGALVCSSTKSAVVDTPEFGERLMYAIESPEVWFEDIGSGTLENGKSFVALEAVFAQTVNLNQDYQVFLTPVCSQPLLLSVSEKAPQGFSVLGVTLDGQPSDCGFDYRVTAKRLGYEDQRLEPISFNDPEAGDG